MTNLPRIDVRSPRPFDVVGDGFSLCGLGRANEGVIGTAVLKDNHGTVLAQVSPMFVPNSGFLFALFDFPVLVGAPSTPEGVLTVEADNPSGLPQNDFRVIVPLTFGRVLLGIQVPGADLGSLHRLLDGLGYEFTDETDNDACRLFLR